MWLQDGPQDGSKMANVAPRNPRVPKYGPRWLQESRIWHQAGPRWSQYGPKTAQYGPRLRLPNTAQDGLQYIIIVAVIVATAAARIIKVPYTTRY
jgi:hypothetical protein